MPNGDVYFIPEDLYTKLRSFGEAWPTMPEFVRAYFTNALLAELKERESLESSRVSATKSISLHGNGSLQLVKLTSGSLGIGGSANGMSFHLTLQPAEAKAFRQAIGEVMPETVHEGGLGK